MTVLFGVLFVFVQYVPVLICSYDCGDRWRALWDILEGENAEEGSDPV